MLRLASQLHFRVQSPSYRMAAPRTDMLSLLRAVPSWPCSQVNLDFLKLTFSTNNHRPCAWLSVSVAESKQFCYLSRIVLKSRVNTAAQTTKELLMQGTVWELPKTNSWDGIKLTQGPDDCIYPDCKHKKKKRCFAHVVKFDQRLSWIVLDQYVCGHLLPRTESYQ